LHISSKNQNPSEARTSNKPDVTHFCVFGSRAWAPIPSKKRKALDPHSTACIFVGYLDGVKGYRIIDPYMDHLVIECSVQFEESVSHAPQELHADAFVLPPIRDYESAHSESNSNLSYDIELEDSEHVDS
jgi:hypothetical protein